MQRHQEVTEQIERYLSGAMAGAERQAFEASMDENPGLAEEVALQKALQQSLGNPRRRQMLDALTDVVEQEKRRTPTLRLHWSSKRWLAAAAAAAVLLAAIGTWQYLQQDTETLPLAEQPAPQPQPDAKRDITPPPPNPVPPGPEPARRALASRRAFAPNPALDPLVGTLVRGGNAEVSVTRPANDAQFTLKNGRIRFEMAGGSPALPEVTLLIYNNRETDFAAGKPVHEARISVQGQVFRWGKTLRLDPGRYYAVVSAPDDEEPLVVLRFYAGKPE